jgi:hypothetical protein
VQGSACPNSRQSLESHDLEALYGRSVTVDVCTGCQGIWFDEGETLQLSPWGTLTLFRIINTDRGAARQPLGARLECPRCRLRLTLTTDQQRTTRFHYHRCARGHGRFITFFQFLRARNFVRTLTPREIADLRTRVRQVNCSNCGAPVHLDRDVACGYCRSPISMLDPDQVTAAIAELQASDARRREIDPSLPLTLMTERLRTERLFAEAEAIGGRNGPSLTEFGRSSLVERGLGIVLDWMSIA